MTMPRAGLWIAASLLAAAPAVAQDAEVFQPPKKGGFEVEALFRQEWTKKIFDGPDERHDENRWRLRAMPRVTAGGDRFNVVLGGDFNWSRDDNVDPFDTGVQPIIMRDNYRSRNARLDLASASLQPTNWFKIEGGRFVMPIAFTEMIWDHDLRPQGGAVRLGTGKTGDIESLSASFLFTQGGHVFDDGEARMMALSAGARLNAGNDTILDLTASLIDFKNLEDLEPMIRRQNSRDDSPERLLAHTYRIIDVVGRVQVNGNVPLQLVADVAWNTRLSDDNRGIWLAVVLGSLRTSRARLDYTFANVDRDATVAAFATDDFFWATGWLGHRLELGTKSGGRITTHIIGQLQKFKASLIEEERNHWVQRLRIELRLVP